MNSDTRGARIGLPTELLLQAVDQPETGPLRVPGVNSGKDPGAAETPALVFESGAERPRSLIAMLDCQAPTLASN